MTFTTPNRSWHCNGNGEWESHPYIIRDNGSDLTVTDRGRRLEGETEAPQHATTLAAIEHAERHAAMYGNVQVHTIDRDGALRSLAVERVDIINGRTVEFDDDDQADDYDERHRLLCVSKVAEALRIPTVWGCADDIADGNRTIGDAPAASHLGNLTVTEAAFRIRNRIVHGDITTVEYLNAVLRDTIGSLAEELHDVLGHATLSVFTRYVIDVFDLVGTAS